MFVEKITECSQWFLFSDPPHLLLTEVWPWKGKSNVLWYDFEKGNVMLTLLHWQTKHTQNECIQLDRVAAGSREHSIFIKDPPLINNDGIFLIKMLHCTTLCSNNFTGPYINLIRKWGGGQKMRQCATCKILFQPKYYTDQTKQYQFLFTSNHLTKQFPPPKKKQNSSNLVWI
jgi:hypothetical protein